MAYLGYSGSFWQAFFRIFFESLLMAQWPMAELVQLILGFVIQLSSLLHDQPFCFFSGVITASFRVNKEGITTRIDERKYFFHHPR